MAALKLSSQIHRAASKQLLGVFVVVLLVLFDRGQVVPAGFED